MTYDPRDHAPGRAALGLVMFVGLSAIIGCVATNTAKAHAAAKPLPTFERAAGSPLMIVVDEATGLKPTPTTSPKAQIGEVYGAGYDTIDNPPATDAPEVLLLTAIGYGESRGECKGQGDKCLAAVMHVAMNRLSAGRWGDTLEDVVFANKQFSALNSGDVNLRLIARMALTDGDADWQRAKDVARKVLSGEIKDPTQGALFYHERTISPKWAKAMRRVRVIENHVFYREGKA